MTGMRLRPGLELLEESVGEGAVVERHHNYRIQLKMWLHRGEPVRWKAPWGNVSEGRLMDDGTTLVTALHLNRGQVMNGLFYGMLGMRVGGSRRLQIAPHLAYAEQGVADVIPPNALLIAEIQVISEV